MGFSFHSSCERFPSKHRVTLRLVSSRLVSICASMCYTCYMLAAPRATLTAPRAPRAASSGTPRRAVRGFKVSVLTSWCRRARYPAAPALPPSLPPAPTHRLSVGAQSVLRRAQNIWKISLIYFYAGRRVDCQATQGFFSTQCFSFFFLFLFFASSTSLFIYLFFFSLSSPYDVLPANEMEEAERREGWGRRESGSLETIRPVVLLFIVVFFLVFFFP